MEQAQTEIHFFVIDSGDEEVEFRVVGRKVLPSGSEESKTAELAEALGTVRHRGRTPRTRKRSNSFLCP